MKRISGTKSQAGQDQFLFNALQSKRSGKFVEVGSWHPKRDSNTFALEKKLGWDGIAFELDAFYAKLYNKKRDSLCHCVDATKVEFADFFEWANLPRRIDYLQLDIDPAPNTLKALKHIPLETYRFSVITFEHDLYRDSANARVQSESRSILEAAGYIRVVSNVQVDGRPFEDWWVDPQVVETRFIEENSRTDVDWQTLFD